MLAILASHWESTGGPSLFGYITTRAVAAFITAFVVGLVLGRPIINALYRAGMRSKERTYGDINTQSKAGTPVMGGFIMLAAGLGAGLLWCDLSNLRIQLLIGACLWFAFVGFVDDYGKVKHGGADAGMSRFGKYLSQVGFGILLGICIMHPALTPFPAGTQGLLYLPFLKAPLLNIGWFYVPFAVVVTIYSANAVNFADGLDGLAVVPSMFVLLVFGVFAYLLGHATFSEYLFYPFQPGAGEVAVFCAALVGACLAFLWFNAHPAEVFMGDTGSLMLGGAFGTVCLLLKQEALLLLVGGVFLAEILSTLIQERVGLARGKRIFFRAPFHHTFQHRGMSETKIAVRVWIISAILAAVALSTLKIR
jgi:phospho-N-acetylmuramoyl-pentapeptide-transferase